MRNLNPYDAPQEPCAGAVQPSRKRGWIVCGISACAIGLAATVGPAPVLMDYASYSSGMSLRPIGFAPVMLGSALGVAIVLPLALACLVLGRRSRAGIILGCISIAVAVTSIVLNPFLFNYITTSRGYLLLE